MKSQTFIIYAELDESSDDIRDQYDLAQSIFGVYIAFFYSSYEKAKEQLIETWGADTFKIAKITIQDDNETKTVKIVKDYHEKNNRVCYMCSKEIAGIILTTGNNIGYKEFCSKLCVKYYHRKSK